MNTFISTKEFEAVCGVLKIPFYWMVQEFKNHVGPTKAFHYITGDKTPLYNEKAMQYVSTWYQYHLFYNLPFPLGIQQLADELARAEWLPNGPFDYDAYCCAYADMIDDGVVGVISSTATS